MTNVNLTDAELILLDGRVSEKVQAKVDAAKRREARRATMPETSAEIAGFIADVVARAEKDGKLRLQRKNLRYCHVCGKQAGYAKYKRNSRYHRKGDSNPDRPLYISGKELSDAFVSIKGYATLGCCDECWSKAEQPLRRALADVQAELPQDLRGHALYRKYDRRHCTACDWNGHEGDMGALPAMMGGGYYPGQCPSCGAKNLPLGRTIIERVEGFEVVKLVETAEPTP